MVSRDGGATPCLLISLRLSPDCLATHHAFRLETCAGSEATKEGVEVQGDGELAGNSNGVKKVINGLFATDEVIVLRGFLPSKPFNRGMKRCQNSQTRNVHNCVNIGAHSEGLSSARTVLRRLVSSCCLQ